MAPTFPNADRIELDPSPLELVVCQLRFPTLLELAGNQPPLEFQRRIGELYPVANRKRQSEVELGPELSPRMSVSQFWSFESTDGDWLVSLGVTWLALEAKRYRRFDEFVGRFRQLVGHAREIYSIRVRDRLGLRYVDRISRTRFTQLPADWLNQVNSELLPLRRLRGERDSNISSVESRFCFGDNFLTIRSGHVDGSFPGASFDELTLDFDCYTERRGGLDEIEALLREFKGITYNGFRWAIGDLIREFPPARR